MWKKLEKTYKPYEVPMKEEAMKRAFALSLSKGMDRFEAAATIEPDIIKAGWIAQNWPADEFVQELQREQHEPEKSKDQLPTKEQLAMEIIKEARDTRASRDDKVKLFTLAAKLLNYIDKPAEAANTTNVVNTRVYVLPARATSIEDFEQRSAAHQAKLINAS